ncbi:MAG: ATP-binding protein [Opitutales bacterium]
MPDNQDAADGQLRFRAEKVLQEQRAGATGSETDPQRLVHELQVHQIELELQNQELYRARNAAESAAEEFSNLYDFAPVGYLTLDREGVVRRANLTCTTLLGIERSQLVGKRFGALPTTSLIPVWNDFLKRVFGNKTKQSCELHFDREGKPRMDVQMEAEASVSGNECYAVLRDITELKRAESDRLLLSKLESTGILAGGIAHDFNNLLTVIILNLEMGQKLLPGGKELLRYFSEASKAAELGRGLTEQLITLAKGGAPVLKTTELSTLIQDSVRFSLSGSRVGCAFALDQQLWPAEVDAGQIGHVIRNIALNAREAMSEGGVINVVAENVALTVEQQPPLAAGHYVRVSIVDEGGGIPENILPKIFDPYFSTKQRGHQKGMGLGLTICYSVVQKHGGTITVESNPGTGTAFYIYLPAASRAATKDETPETPKSKLGPQSLNVLVMDDEDGVRDVVGAILRHLGHKVQLVDEGQKAVETYQGAKERGQPFDVVFLDLTVRNGIGGHETMKALRAWDPDVTAVVMSGYSSDPVLLEYKQHGFKGTLVKPFNLETIKEVLSQFPL